VKLILVFPFNLLSHYLRCLVLADSYDKNQYRILFLYSPQYARFVEQHGYETFACEQFQPEEVMECARNFDFSWLNEADLDKVLVSQIAAIRHYNAAIVIGDVAPTLNMAAEYTGAQYVSLLNGYMTKYYAVTRKVPRMHVSSDYLKVLPDMISDLITDFAEKLTFRKIHAPFKLLRKKYDLQAKADYISEIEGDTNLICDLPDLFPQKNLPANYSFTGPLIYQYADLESDWLEEIPLEKPVIFVSMGSTGDWERLTFLNDPYYSRYVVITAGDTNKYVCAPHIISRDFVNLTQVLKKSDLMICHGGNGTIYPGIINRVYLLCLSSHFEQEWNMHALEKNGYGKSADHFNEQDWKDQLSALLPHYQHH
jgi:UDP:flavonoid glycosyltransferase YjiC (YdhE family)